MNENQVADLQLAHEEEHNVWLDIKYAIHCNIYDLLVSYIEKYGITEAKKKELLSIITGRKFMKTGQDFSKIENYLNNLDL